ncbi:MAG: nickel-responsive transcriptional regulator NikR [Candidatus Cloacimonas sp. 4484_209]|nr:MAG: nickel-responsive transcriptional regulator NikR [Candidatus Cloacimonas sp. 4484_209]
MEADSFLVRFGVSLNSKLLRDFDRSIVKMGYSSRSEAIRDLIRNYLVALDWKEKKGNKVGTITLVYNHEKRKLSEQLDALQHKYINLIISMTHVHLNEHNCLEVVIIKGDGEKIRELASKLISLKGVKHGKLTMTTTGKGLA